MSASADHLQFDLPLLDEEERPIPPYRERISGRARRMQIRVGPWRGIELILPKRHTRAEKEAFLHSNRDWMFQQWQEICADYEEALHVVPPAEIELIANGKHYAVSYQAGARNRYAENSSKLEITTRVDDDVVRIAVLRKWLAAVARVHLEPRLKETASRHGLTYKRLQVRAQDGRWGSCTSNDTITLNCKLMFLRPELVDYLLVHELCHTRHLDHSARYWKLVGEIEPDYRELEKRLDDAWRNVPGWAVRNP